MKPVIGIASDFDVEKGGYFCVANYVRAIEKAGAIPVILPYIKADEISSMLGFLSGIVLSGGGDFSAEVHDGPPHPALRKMIPERDTFEFALARSALDQRMPILGICRGMQLLNVVGGGAIYLHTLDELTDVADHRDGTPLDQMVHAVHIEPNTQLSRLCGEGALSFRVNSMHHQAISRLAPGYVISARADDGIVEAIEAPERPFVVGVQWHPEWMYDAEPACRNLIDNFVKACT
ncbi:gamma-glutamyl-gamma-aminobutyrate hydrolase family protein [Bradyrhizobium elkanii]|uniref:Gamma-glutamyl-gamma-aminobutyrate hydrolase family protein n=1 Tax=Bradyrhizobium elkanii TaxID=29448 RepID=A0A4U6RAM3_BRAEL|nr:gamma-glutamyl-gamma-aminobutyrate hydrolase family protein [Bradyrhizobium elkanii]TKV70849.1 gamma-glutamyl-gamma-aminobutyrate hydrolase family protein [Bradyrhizobium elkanii]